MFFIIGVRVPLGSRSQMFFIIGVIKNFAIFIGKHLCWNLFLIKLLAERGNFFRRGSGLLSSRPAKFY